MKKQKVYIVLSKSDGFVFCTTSKAKASKARVDKEFDENMSGALLPYVFIVETVLN